MKYMNYIDIPNWEKYKGDLLYFYEKLGDPKRVWWCYHEDQVQEHIPEFYNMWEKEFGIHLRQLIFFVNYKNDPTVMDPNDDRAIFIHVDSQDVDDQDERLPLNQQYATQFNPKHAINIPLVNCEGSYTLWYQQINNNPHTYYPKYDCGGIHPLDAKELYRGELSKPAVLKIDIPHGVYIPENSPRIVATMRFYEPLDFLMN